MPVLKVPEDMEKKIEEISEALGLDKDEVILEAIREFVEEYEEYEEALRRLQDENDELLTPEQLRDSLGL